MATYGRPWSMGLIRHGGSAATSPPTTGLKAWFKGDAGVTQGGGTVSAWADQSGNGNDVTQGTGANQPAFTASAINGIPGIAYSANAQILTRATSPLSVGSARTVVGVAKPAAGSGSFNPGGTVAHFKTTSGHDWTGYLAVVGASTYGWGNNVVSDSLTSPPTILNTPCVVEISTTVGQLPTFVINAVAYTAAGGNVVTTDDGTNGFQIGNVAQASSQFFAGSICEVLVYDHILSAGDLTTLRQYLQAKYAINLGV